MCRRHNRGKTNILPRYSLAPLPGTFSILLLSYTKMVKIVAIGSVFATKNSLKCLCGRIPLAECAQTPSQVGGGEQTALPFLTPARHLQRLNFQRTWRLDSRRQLTRCPGSVSLFVSKPPRLLLIFPGILEISLSIKIYKLYSQDVSIAECFIHC